MDICNNKIASFIFFAICLFCLGYLLTANFIASCILFVLVAWLLESLAKKCLNRSFWLD